MGSNEEKRSPLHEQDSSKLLNINSKLCIEPESHLQSLGFTINNGKARFKLDEDAPLYSSTPMTNFCPVDPDDTLSFVVLGKDSLDSIQQSSRASYVDIQQKCMSIDYNSMIASWDSTEVHQKLTELLQENTKLKETLKQNNIAMKQQFNTLAMWQEEIMQVHQNHKQKFAETRRLINYLKKENAELKMRLSSDLTSHTEMGYEFLDANDEQSDEKGRNESIVNDLSKSTLCELNTALNEKTVKSTLEQSATSESVQNIKQLEKQAAEKMQLLEEERIAFNKEKEDLEEAKKLLDNQKKNLEVEYKNLNEAKELLQQERISLQEEQTSLDQQSQLYELHYKKALETEKKKFEEQYQQLVTELGVLHEAVQKKELCIMYMQEEFMEQKENINLLQTQLKLYEEDFKQERKFKESLLEMKSTLNVDLQKQVEFNVQLQREIDRLKSCRSPSNGTELEAPLVSSFSCPKCECTFANVQNLEGHVNHCLNLD